MTQFTAPARLLAGIAAAAALCAWPAALQAATRSVDEHRPADAAGEVEIHSVAGKIEVVGWDKAEVAVSGTVGSDVDAVEVTGSGTRTSVNVKLHSGGMNFGWHDSGEANLVVKVPARSSLTVNLVSADLHITGVGGNQDLHTVSGDVAASAQRELRVRTVSGDVRVTAGPDTKVIEIGTVSGDVNSSGGGGDVSVTTVSGDGNISAGVLSRARFKTVSGDFMVTGDLTADGRLEAESVSGDLSVHFSGAMPPAAFDLQSFSGDLSTCGGRKGAHEGFGPGSRMSWQEGAGTARVRVDTKSGDVTLCSKK
ncbi:MAG: DUF4097 family beta strand repeat protein [Proteobacteria bacterium]|nr:DUF4097 family beta strand repeat protein [Pseudomonadota bacterium]